MYILQKQYVATTRTCVCYDMHDDMTYYIDIIIHILIIELFIFKMHI